VHTFRNSSRVVPPALGQGEAIAVGVLDRDVRAAPQSSRVARGQPDDLVHIVVVADDHVDAVAVRELLRCTPPTELVGRCADRAVAVAGGPLDLEPAVAPIAPTDRLIVDRGVEAEPDALNQIPHTGKCRAELRVSRNIRFHEFILS
jgi:hypothetical protein